MAEVPRFPRCWFWLILALCLGFIAVDMVWRCQWFDRISAYQAGSLPPTSEARQRIIPLNGMDGLYWIEYAQEMVAKGSVRVREVLADNAPYGREQHWSSGFAWWLVLLGWTRHAVTGESIGHSIEIMAAYANPLLLVGVVAFFALLTARRFGWAVGAWLAVAMVTSQPFFSGFPPNQPGHHGLDSAAALGTVLFLLMGGFGWVRGGKAVGVPGVSLVPEAADAKKWFVLSALSGAVGMWSSAVTQIQVFIGVGLGALAVGFLLGRRGAAGAAVCRAELWRLWGRVGALGSLGFYLLEYFPGHFGLRLEVNHPFFAAAWWGAGELIGDFMAWRTGAALWPAQRSERTRRVAAWLALALPGLVIMIGGARWCCLRDPIQWRIAKVVSEGLSLWKIALRLGWMRVGGYVAAPLVLLLLGIAATCVRRLGRVERTMLAASLLAALPVVVDSLLQNRWVLILGAMSLPPFVGAIALLPRILGPRAWLATLALAATALFGGLPARELRIGWNWHRTTRNGAVTVDQEDIYMIFMRHVAQALRRQAGPGEITVLANPNDSATLIYYGGFRTIGTLYWENNDGIKAAAAIYAAEDDDTARRLIAARGIRYLVSSSEHNFIDGYCYFATGYFDRERTARSFASRIFFQGTLPVWLRPVKLPVMPGIDPTKMTVRVYEFVPDQTLAEFWVNLASANFENGHVADAVAGYRKSVAADPAGMPGLTGLALALAELGRSEEAEAAFTRACPVVPPASLAQFNFDFGRHCQSSGNYQAACAHFEAALKLVPDNPVALNNLAWLLATAPLPELRNGPHAMQLIQRAMAASAESSFLYYDTLAAVLAELGDFPKAVASEEQAIALARRSERNEFLAEMDQRRQLYAQHQPYRLQLPTAAR